MKQTPILFSTPMVQSLNRLEKTQTRRTSGLDEINKQGWVYSHSSIEGNVPYPAKKYDTAPWYLFNPPNGNHKSWVLQCPYGQPGDILWVRETFQYRGSNGNLIGWRGEHCNSGFLYKEKDVEYENIPDFKWKPSIHMPKEAARIWLQIVSVKVQRLQDISEQDAVAEGIERKIKFPEESPNTWYYRDYLAKDRFAFGTGFGPKQCFRKLWEKINGPESWKVNPWVWVVEFKRVEKPSSIEK